MGKCFSKVDKGQRIKKDKYLTHYSMTEQILDVCNINKKYKILEPAAGENSIVKVLKKRKYKNIESYDLYPTTKDVKKFNFFDQEKKVDFIITNPPFKIATKFIEKAMEISKHGFLFLMPLPYLHGKERYDKFYKNKEVPFKLKTVYIFVRMPEFLSTVREDGKYKTAMQVYAWYFFEKSEIVGNNKPEIEWIDNSDYILKEPRKKKNGKKEIK